MHKRSMPAASIMPTISAALTPVLKQMRLRPYWRNRRSISGTDSKQLLDCRVGPGVDDGDAVVGHWNGLGRA